MFSSVRFVKFMRTQKLLSRIKVSTKLFQRLLNFFKNHPLWFDVNMYFKENRWEILSINCVAISQYMSFNTLFFSIIHFMPVFLNLLNLFKIRICPFFANNLGRCPKAILSSSVYNINKRRLMLIFHLFSMSFSL